MFLVFEFPARVVYVQIDKRSLPKPDWSRRGPAKAAGKQAEKHAEVKSLKLPSRGATMSNTVQSEVPLVCLA